MRETMHNGVRYRARVRLVCTSRWRLFKAFLRGRYEEAWDDWTDNLR